MLLVHVMRICHDARSHVTMHGHMSRCTVTCHDARSHKTLEIKSSVTIEHTPTTNHQIETVSNLREYYFCFTQHSSENVSFHVIAYSGSSIDISSGNRHLFLRYNIIVNGSVQCRIWGPVSYEYTGSVLSVSCKMDVAHSSEPTNQKKGLQYEPPVLINYFFFFSLNPA
jgi:hypothetical protein